MSKKVLFISKGVIEEDEEKYVLRNQSICWLLVSTFRKQSRAKMLRQGRGSHHSKEYIILV